MSSATERPTIEIAAGQPAATQFAQPDWALNALLDDFGPHGSKVGVEVAVNSVAARSFIGLFR